MLLMYRVVVDQTRTAVLPTLPRGGGSYMLWLHLPMDCPLTPGRLGTHTLPAGSYVYTGSALGGLRGRVARHLRARRVRHWHLDWLLDVAAVAEVWFNLGSERLECLWAQGLATLPEARMPVARFGASDCRCPSHLIHWIEMPEPTSLLPILGCDSFAATPQVW